MSSYRYHRRPLQQGDRVRIEGPDAPVVQVLRVSPGAAYIGTITYRPVTVPVVRHEKDSHGRERTVPVLDEQGQPVMRSFQAQHVTCEPYSRNAFVWTE